MLSHEPQKKRAKRSNSQGPSRDGISRNGKEISRHERDKNEISRNQSKKKGKEGHTLRHEARRHLKESYDTRIQRGCAKMDVVIATRGGREQGRDLDM